MQGTQYPKTHRCRTGKDRQRGREFGRSSQIVDRKLASWTIGRTGTAFALGLWHTDGLDTDGADFGGGGKCGRVQPGAKGIQKGRKEKEKVQKPKIRRHGFQLRRLWQRICAKNRRRDKRSKGTMGIFDADGASKCDGNNFDGELGFDGWTRLPRQQTHHRQARMHFCRV